MRSGEAKEAGPTAARFALGIRPGWGKDPPELMNGRRDSEEVAFGRRLSEAVNVWNGWEADPTTATARPKRGEVR